MIQYRDGSFSEIMEYKQALEQFLETPSDLIKALHLGSEKELEDKKNERSVRDEINSLKDDVEELKFKLRGSSLQIPNEQEIKRYAEGVLYDRFI